MHYFLIISAIIESNTYSNEITADRRVSFIKP